MFGFFSLCCPINSLFYFYFINGTFLVLSLHYVYIYLHIYTTVYMHYIYNIYKNNNSKLTLKHGDLKETEASQQQPLNTNQN